MNRFSKFEENYRQAVEDINGFLNDEDPQVKHMVTWLFNTEHNPFGIFVDSSPARTMDSAEGFAGVCHQISHALVDDGDISFPVVNGKSHIAFVGKHDCRTQDEIEKYLMSESDHVRVSSLKVMDAAVSTIVTFLENVYQFTSVFDQEKAVWFKRCEEFDKGRK